MSEIVKSEGASVVAEMPATADEDVKFPPLPAPTDSDFEDDVPEEEKEYIKTKFADLNAITIQRLHCTACDRHLGSSSRSLTRVRIHPLLRTLVCQTCHIFYNSGEFEKGDDGSELYCRWCGQGGQVFCCSDCPHVFCAKCIKRNLGTTKITEIKSLDDWKCFKCNPECLRTLRAICWALFQYCKMRNEVAGNATDPQIKDALMKQCTIDETFCCKNKKRIEKTDLAKKKEESKKPSPAPAPVPVTITKIPPTIQVKKFASINLDETPKQEKKLIKRAASPKNKVLFVKTSLPGAPVTRILNPLNVPPMKKIRLAGPMMNTIRYVNDTRMQSYQRIKPKNSVNVSNNFNGFNNTNQLFTQIHTNPFNNSMDNMVSNDNINLSLDNLTQGLDISTAAAVLSGNHVQNDDVVCTPDLPMGPLNEVNEDNDDDVECITPGPSDTSTGYKIHQPPPLVPCGSNNALTLSSDNIIQMTENDVTVNAVTGGLKFRVDPQTLSSNKMYRLPDGRVFAININPKMPGGYSATIVAVTDNASKTIPAKGTTFAAKLSAVTSPQCSSPVTTKSRRNHRQSSKHSVKSKSGSPNKSDRLCDLNVPVEWYRYNLTDAVDALEYSLNRLHKLKKETTTMYLRTRTISEMKNLHKSLDRLLTTSSKRFGEIKDNLNNDLKQFILRKSDQPANSDDDVEILSNADNDDPIFIDENSVESNNCMNQEVDLTGAGSEHNESGEKEDDESRMDDDTLIIPDHDNDSVSNVNDNCEIVENNSSDNINRETALKCFENMIDKSPKTISENNSSTNNEILENNKTNEDAECINESKHFDDDEVETVDGIPDENTENNKSIETIENNSDKAEDIDKSIEIIETNAMVLNNDEPMDTTTAAKDLVENDSSRDKDDATDENNLLNDKVNSESDKIQDSEISEEMIESLLKDDNSTDCKE